MKTLSKTFLISTVLVTLAGCGKLQDMGSTMVSGYTIRCIEGTRYVLMTSERGLAIAVLVDTNGKPKGCEP